MSWTAERSEPLHDGAQRAHGSPPDVRPCHLEHGADRGQAADPGPSTLAEPLALAADKRWPGREAWLDRAPLSCSSSLSSAGTIVTGHRALSSTYWLTVPGSTDLAGWAASTTS